MANFNNSDKERELRHLRRVNRREQEESARRIAELRAVQAQNKQVMRELHSRNEELRQLQADIVSSYRDAVPIERKMDENSKRTGIQKGWKG